MAHSIHSRKLKEALLGDLDMVKIGEFVLWKHEGRINVLTEEEYKTWNKLPNENKAKELQKIRRDDRQNLKSWTPKHITKEDIPEWLR